MSFLYNFLRPLFIKVILTKGGRMSQRLNYFKVAPKAMEIFFSLEKYISTIYKEKKSLDYSLIELVKIRVAQVNGCAFCLDMHTKDARAAGETEQRIFALNAWKDAPFFNAHEKAALDWAEKLTKISEFEIADSDYEMMREYFSEESLLDLTIIINAINNWTRIAKAFKPEVGGYQPGDYGL